MAKCPYAAAAQAKEAESAQRCPYSGATTTATAETPTPTASAGKCPYANKGSSNTTVPTCGTALGADAWQEREATTDWSQATGEQLKAHYAQVYDAMAIDVRRRETVAKEKGVNVTPAARLRLATLLMTALGYNEEDLRVVGDDVWMMQGTGNPHPLAKIQPGETVVDLGSGFGIDAFLAAHRTGPTGRVIGIDQSIQEITAALQRVSARNAKDSKHPLGPIYNTDFRHGDIEYPPVADNSVDCVISNGGFCLVPDKPYSFRQIYRILKSGGNGRMSISCTARKKELPPLSNPEQHYPSCFNVFIPMKDIEEMLTKIGFTDVLVDTSNSSMDVWDVLRKEQEKDAKAAAERKAREQNGEQQQQQVEQKKDDEELPPELVKKVTIHSRDPGHKHTARYAFLDDMNMDEYFGRVTIFAKKP